MPSDPAASQPAATPAPKQESDWWLMTKKFLKKGTSIASFSPSQGPLCRAMSSNIDYDAAKCNACLQAAHPLFDPTQGSQHQNRHLDSAGSRATQHAQAV